MSFKYPNNFGNNFTRNQLKTALEDSRLLQSLLGNRLSNCCCHELCEMHLHANHKCLRNRALMRGNLLTTAILQVKRLVSNNQLHSCTYSIVLTKALPL